VLKFVVVVPVYSVSARFVVGGVLAVVVVLLFATSAVPVAFNMAISATQRM